MDGWMEGGRDAVNDGTGHGNKSVEVGVGVGVGLGGVLSWVTAQTAVWPPPLFLHSGQN